MTQEQYLSEHSAHEGEDGSCNICAQCGESIDNSGWSFTDFDIWLHRECLLPYIAENYTLDEIAKKFGLVSAAEV